MSKPSRSDFKAKASLAVLLALLLVICSATSASALSITPGRTTIDFEPGLEKDVTLTITNNEHKQFNAHIYVEGDLKDYVTIENSIVEFNESDNSKPLTYSVKLPERIDTPGDHWAKIVIMELPSGWDAPEGETRIIATVAVIHQLRVKVPYPGKYMQLEMSVHEAAPNESVSFFVKMYNLGKEDIAKAQATIDIIGPTNEVIDSIETGSKAVKSMQRQDLTAVWKSMVNPGMYHAVATVRYDGEVGKVEKNFYVGNMLVKVLDVSVKDFRLGGIAKFDIMAESEWNQPISNVYASMIINDEDEQNKVADLKSASVDMQPYERTHLYTYWDTEGINEGDYITSLTLHYAGRTTEREIMTRVGLESIQTDIVGISVGAVTAEGIDIGQSSIVILIAVLVAINLGWFLYFRKRRR